MHIIGLTGGVATGKSTTADVFKSKGVLVVDCDAIVHQVQTENDSLKYCLEKTFPTAFEGGKLDRNRLSNLVMGDLDKLCQIEEMTLPYVHQAINQLLAIYKTRRIPVVVIDVPLLFEKKMEGLCDSTICVYVDADLQKERFLARPNMTSQKLVTVLKNQIPLAEKIKMATYAIQSSNIPDLENQVKKVLVDIQKI